MLSLSRRFAFAFTLLPLIVVCPFFYRNHAIIFSRKEASDAPGYASEGAEKEPFGMSKNLFLKMLRKVQNIAVNSRISGVKETHFNTRKFLRSCFLPENFLLFSGFLLGFFLFFSGFLPGFFLKISSFFPLIFQFLCAMITLVIL